MITTIRKLTAAVALAIALALAATVVPSFAEKAHAGE